MHLRLPQLFVNGGINPQEFDLNELRGKCVAVYFWTSTNPRVGEDFETLKQLTDRYQYRGLQVVYVNLDKETARARDFLSGRLTAGVHLFQAGGLDSPVAERFGVQSLPHTILVDRDGKLLKHSVPVFRIEEDLAAQLGKK